MSLKAADRTHPPTPNKYRTAFIDANDICCETLTWLELRISVPIFKRCHLLPNSIHTSLTGWQAAVTAKVTITPEWTVTGQWVPWQAVAGKSGLTCRLSWTMLSLWPQLMFFCVGEVIRKTSQLERLLVCVREEKTSKKGRFQLCWHSNLHQLQKKLHTETNYGSKSVYSILK